jgi:ABC-type branched-subunit amino acid transport system permease subunit
VLLVFFLQRTKRGAAMQAVAMDHEAATASASTWAQQRDRLHARAALAALAGGLVGPLLYVNPSMGGTFGIKGFAGAILGGFGSIPGPSSAASPSACSTRSRRALPGLLGTRHVPGLHRDHHDPADRHLRREDGEPRMRLRVAGTVALAAVPGCCRTGSTRT